MNAAEALSILRMVKAICPSQAIDEMTPEAWAAILDDVRYDDARIAVVEIAKQPLDLGVARYIEPGHIIGQVRHLRSDRLLAAAPIDPPAWIEPGSREQIDWMRDEQTRIMDGRPRLREVGR